MIRIDDVAHELRGTWHTSVAPAVKPQAGGLPDEV